MLYLAEVQKKSGIMGSRAELKLLACQRSEQIWNAVSGEELIPLSADQANQYNTGALVLVDLTNNRQVQRFLEAGRQLVNILQNFSKLQERVRSQEEEIEQWKASLTFQSQELQRRELDMEARQEQIQNMDGDLALLQQQREELERKHLEIQELQAELVINRQNLDAAWEQLKGEQQHIAQLQASDPGSSAGLSSEQSHIVHNWLDQVGSLMAPIHSLPESLLSLTQAVAAQQATIQQSRERLELEVQNAQQFQELNQTQLQDIAQRRATLDELLRSQATTRQQLMEKQQEYQIAKRLKTTFEARLQEQIAFQQQLGELAGFSNPLDSEERVDVEALENMPMADLQQVVANLQRDLIRIETFVNDQEDELRFQQQTVDELQTKIQQASEYDCLHLEAELADEKDRHRLLDETLIGQRRTLKDRENILNIHLAILQRRQDASESGNTDGIRLLLNQFRDLQHQQRQELQEISNQLPQLPTEIEQLQATLDQQRQDQQALEQEIQALERNLLIQELEAATSLKQTQSMADMLQLLQTHIDQMQTSLGSVNHLIGETQASREQQQQLLASVKQSLNGVHN